MITLTCPWCDGDVALVSPDAPAARCEACLVVVELAADDVPELAAAAA